MNGTVSKALVVVAAVVAVACIKQTFTIVFFQSASFVSTLFTQQFGLK